MPIYVIINGKSRRIYFGVIAWQRCHIAAAAQAAAASCYITETSSGDRPAGRSGADHPTNYCKLYNMRSRTLYMISICLVVALKSHTVLFVLLNNKSVSIWRLLLVVVMYTILYILLNGLVHSRHQIRTSRRR